MVRLIDSTPIPLGKLCRWADWNGRIHGMKMHVVYDPNGDSRSPRVTAANVNDVDDRPPVLIQAGTTTCSTRATAVRLVADDQ